MYVAIKVMGLYALASVALDGCMIALKTTYAVNCNVWIGIMRIKCWKTNYNCIFGTQFIN